ncbi:MAG: hypothetical protein ACRD8O_17895 [Bryobacteraceae bacterium]
MRTDFSVRFFPAGEVGRWFSIHDRDGKVSASPDWLPASMVASRSDAEVRPSLIAGLLRSSPSGFEDLALGESGSPAAE